MTTLKDYARDLVIEVIEKMEKINTSVGDIEYLTDEEIDVLVDDFINNVTNRLIGE